MKIRLHCGGFEESMATVREIEPTKAAVIAVVRTCYRLAPDYPVKVKTTKYADDPRNGWKTYIVVIDGFGTFGFTDGPLRDG